MNTTPFAATDSVWADVETVLDSLADTHGTRCAVYNEGFVRKAHAEFLADSDTADEFEERFGEWMIELVGMIPG
jgi:hypothetical protein